MHKNHGLKSMFWCLPRDVWGLGWLSSVVIPGDFSASVSPRLLVLWCSSHLIFQIIRIADLPRLPLATLMNRPASLMSSRRCVPLRLPLVVFLPLRSSRLHRLGYLSIAIHHDFHFIALLRSSTVDDIYVVGHAVSDSCLLLSFASLNYLKIFNF